MTTHLLAASTPRRQEFAVHPAVAAFTGLRLAVVPAIILAMAVAPAWVAAPLGVFILADVYDGVFARRLGCDDSYRRALDSVTDRLAIHAVFGAGVLLGMVPGLFWVFLLVRDAYCGALCAKVFVESRCTIRADWPYRSFNLALAGWIIAAPHAPDATLLIASVCIAVLGLFVAVDLTRAFARLRQRPWLQAEVVSAAWIRRS